MSAAPVREGAQLEVQWEDNAHVLFDALWLRGNCACLECRHPSGQRLLDIAQVEGTPRIASVLQANGTLSARFEDGHEASWDPDWLRAESAPAERSPRRLWNASLQSSLPEHSFDAVESRGDALRAWLADVDELGFAILRGGPTELGVVTRIAELFGYVRETNYGRLFDVRSVVSPTNLAFTGLALGAHTDNPYRDPVPTLQLLHCVSSSARGGDSTLVDGFLVAGDLDARQFELLARQPVRFRYADDSTELEHETPVLDVGPDRNVRAVRFNTRSANVPASAGVRYYEAYRQFGRMLDSSGYRIQFRLDPGDLFIVDNTRVLHGRTGYASDAGERHLQGCYADRDGLRSTLAVLSR